MRRIALGVVAFVVGVGGILMLLLVFSGRDKAGVDTGSGGGPGQTFPLQGSAHRAAPGFHYSSSPPTSGPHRVVAVPRDGHRLTTDQLLTALEEGNVVLLGHPGPPFPGEVAVQRQIAGGPSTPALLREGQAVLLGTYPGTGGSIVAVAWGHLLRAPSSNDPRLAQFADFWLGAGAPAAK
jgi:Protein of unknown function (DUF3105)